MGGQIEEETEKYDGGNLGHLSWLRLMRAKVFNEPIFEALWENKSDDIKALNSPPEWSADFDIATKADEWKLVTKFGMKWFPMLFGSTDKGKQKSIACVFDYHVKKKRGDWLEIVLKSLKDNAYGDVNNLTYKRIELAKQTVEALQIGGARLDPSDMLNALMNCSFLEVPSGVDIKEMEILRSEPL